MLDCDVLDTLSLCKSKSVEFSEDVEADVSSSEECLVPKLKFQIDEEVLKGVSREAEVPDAS